MEPYCIKHYWGEKNGWHHGCKVDESVNKDVASKTSPFLAVWADAVMKAAAFMIANKPYNQSERTTNITQYVK